MNTPREKYNNESSYKRLVDFLHMAIVECHFTPSELREAATLAAIIYEERKMTQINIPPPDSLDESLKQIRKWTDSNPKNI